MNIKNSMIQQKCKEKFNTVLFVVSQLPHPAETSTFVHFDKVKEWKVVGSISYSNFQLHMYHHKTGPLSCSWGQSLIWVSVKKWRRWWAILVAITWRRSSWFSRCTVCCHHTIRKKVPFPLCIVTHCWWGTSTSQQTSVYGNLDVL